MILRLSKNIIIKRVSGLERIYTILYMLLAKTTSKSSIFAIRRLADD